ncbi:putative O-glycosylation ligase, exosortase A system-associated [Allochromatium palmeri]|uniref:Putative O-glycosylation ligase, exosortase A system-associated n=1 Tax=Allochromatium palmeri TaxID=231048 RepID=A0A6N8EFR6_9GAMM|nr:putative O-glycosylation ligase, exosortase A system-associated [Allochromatium palmeri]MTW21194.1 putative O-glycosylation ligase, exosortase A system-associated [Allochromatium palmeri]
MRDLLIVAIVMAAAVMALSRAWIGVMLWTWLSIMNPHRYSYGFAYSSPLAAIAALATLIGVLTSKEKQSPFKGSTVTVFFIFVIWVTISWQLGVDPSGDYEQWNKVIKIYFMTFIALALLSNKYHIIVFTAVTVGSLALIGIKGGIFTIMTGGSYRVWGPPGSFIGGNNELALALITVVPLLHFLQLQVKNVWLRHGFSASMLLCTAAALGSQSRGALLALVAMGGMFWWRSQKKGMMTVMIAVVALSLIPMMPESWFNRMETIETYEEDGSAMGRINAWIVAWEVAKTHFFGAGMFYQHQFFFNAYGTYEVTVRAAHSIYFQILGNHGFVGLFLFLLLFLLIYRDGGWLRKHARHTPEAKWAADLGAMIQVGLVGYAVGGAFLSLAYFDLPYNMMVMVVIAKRWVQEKGWESDPKMPFLQYAGLKKADSTHGRRQLPGPTGVNRNAFKRRP